MNVEYVLGTEEVCNIPLVPYAEETIEFFNSIATAILHNAGSKRFPDVVSFAFWCRKANLVKLKEAAALEPYRIGRGLVFHIAPSNIPVNFAFTYAFGLLAGNANIVRVPSMRYPQVDILAEVFGKVLPEYPEIAKRTAWVRYPVETATTEWLSKKADARVIWGGDGTVQEIRKIDCNPKSVDIVFPDRYSIGIIDGEKVLEASESELQKLTGGFYNDTWLMDQNACSSPQLMVWLNASEDAKKRFWDKAIEVAKRKYDLQPALAVDKYLQICNDAIANDNIKELKWTKNICCRVELESLPEDITGYRGKCGYFYEYDANGLDELTGKITEKFQTVTYFGLDPKWLQQWVIQNALRGIDRIVPFGNAMDIGVIWDGYDIVRLLSRVVKAD